MTFENEIDTLRDTITIVSAKTYENGIWLEDFEDGLPENGLIYHVPDGGDRTFSEANDDVLHGMVMTEEIASQNLRPVDEHNIKAAYYEREQLELKIRELEEALRRKKSNSGICIVL